MTLNKNPIPFNNTFDIVYGHFINIGIGDCILFEFPFNKEHLTFLVDTGLGNYKAITSFKEKFGISRIDYALITHFHDDHFSNIKFLLKDNPKLRVWMPRYFNDENTELDKLVYANFDQLTFVDWVGITPINILPDLAPSIKVELIGPTRSFIDNLIDKEIVTENDIEFDTTNGKRSLKNFLIGNLDNDQENNLSLIIRINFGEATILLSGDAETSALEALSSTLFPEEMKSTGQFNIDLLKLGHHGSKNAIPKILTNKISPQYAIVTTFPNVKQRFSMNFAKKTLGVEECYRLGYSKHRNLAYQNHISSTFAIKSNYNKKKAIIIPMIYKMPTRNTREVFFIRPMDIETH